MKTTTLTFTISSLILGTLFFAYQANVPQDTRRNTASRAVATALGASDQGIVLLQRDARAKPNVFNVDEGATEDSRLFNFGN